MNPLRLYNSLGRQLEDFVPAAEATGIYTCGPTVYGFRTSVTCARTCSPTHRHPGRPGLGTQQANAPGSFGGDHPDASGDLLRAPGAGKRARGTELVRDYQLLVADR